MIFVTNDEIIPLLEAAMTNDTTFPLLIGFPRDGDNDCLCDKRHLWRTTSLRRLASLSRLCRRFPLLLLLQHLGGRQTLTHVPLRATSPVVDVKDDEET